MRVVMQQVPSMRSQARVLLLFLLLLCTAITEGRTKNRERANVKERNKSKRGDGDPPCPKDGFRVAGGGACDSPATLLHFVETVVSACLSSFCVGAWHCYVDNGATHHPLRRV